MFANDFIRNNAIYKMPVNLVHDIVHNKFADLLMHRNQTIYDNLIGYVEESILSIDCPGLEGEVIKQANLVGQVVNKPSAAQKYRYLSSTSVVINMRMVDMALNYWMLYFSARNHFFSKTTDDVIGDLRATFIDATESFKIVAVFKNCTWSSIDKFSFKVASDAQKDEFSITLEFEDLQIDVEPYSHVQQID